MAVKPSLMQNNIPSSVSSSADPSKLSATISGAILAVSGLIMSLATHFGLSITQNQIWQFAQLAGEAGGSLWLIFGLIRKGTIAGARAFSGRQS